ncbi:hypothetical protein [Microbacterium sp. W4I20]|uniref:hypothetical protein n=1 Tax=Microbacterium sp. W4I20 TaxID=3042262 RepID=UPI002781D9C4|nr:hypothetical protein [Microbacterium sp. W4I20]MDQ0725193.1 hypothetical protein [Microbacterium sp. W4I20]
MTDRRSPASDTAVVAARGPVRVWWVLLLPPTVALTLWVAAVGVLRPAWSLDPGAPWFLPAAGNGWFTCALFAMWALTFVGWWAPNRAALRRTPTQSLAPAPLVVIIGLAAVAAVLGYASFGPCTDGEQAFFSPITWTLMLFVGALETSAVGPDAIGQCAGVLPLSLEVARFAAIATTFTGAALVLIAASREPWNRLVVRRAKYVDLVVGLTSRSLPLVQALLQEPLDLDPRWRSAPRRRPLVVALHDDASDPLVAEATELGAIVLIGNATRPEALRLALTYRAFSFSRAGRRDHPSLHRMYVVADRAQVNRRVLRAAEDVLATTDFSLSDRRVPRITLLLDDSREAQEFRVTHVADRRWFVDALSESEVLADELLRAVDELHPPVILIQGDTGLGRALLERLAWNTWSAMEVAGARGAEAASDASGAPRVVLIDAHADRMLKEWDASAGVTAHLLRPAVISSGDDWEAAADELLSQSADAAVIVTGADAVTSTLRLAQLFPRTRFFLADERVRGVDGFVSAAGPHPRGAVIRFGPVLHSTIVTEEAEVRRYPPEDSWAGLARHQHEMYVAARGQDPRPTRRAWGDPWDEQDERLPEFIREDNVRQLRHLLTGLPELATGLVWVPYDGTRGAVLSASEVGLLAEREHERWVALRLQNGWSGAVEVPPHDETAEARNTRLIREDAERRNDSIRDWETGIPLNQRGAKVRAVSTRADGAARDSLQAWNRRQVEIVLTNLAARGIIPARTDGRRYARDGVVSAVQLTEPVSWTSDAGSELKGGAGDWQVTEADGSLRTVAEAEFPLIYASLGDGRFRRSGTVRARRTLEVESVASLEGASLARAGDWVITDDRGNRWPVPHSRFRASYRLVGEATR